MSNFNQRLFKIWNTRKRKKFFTLFLGQLVIFLIFVSGTVAFGAAEHNSAYQLRSGFNQPPLQSRQTSKVWQTSNDQMGSSLSNSKNDFMGDLSQATPLDVNSSGDSISLLSSDAQGAWIDESKVTRTLYVDNTSVLPIADRSGTQEQPFLSIQQALNAARVSLLSGTGVRIRVHSGLYREGLYLEGDGFDNAPLLIEATEIGKVVISGADVFSGWQPVQGMPGVYQHPWIYDWGAIENPWRKNFGQGRESAYPDFRREMFYLNSKPLSQSLRLADLHAGSFFVEEAANRVFLWMPSGVDINAALIEGAMRPENQDFGVLKTYRLNNLVLRGLTITQGSVAVSGSTRLTGNNILIEDCHFDRNNGMGLNINGDRITIRRSTANENGHAGMVLDVTSMLLEQSEASWNGWKMKEWGYEDNSGAGIKLGNSHNILAKNLKLVGNSYPGLWFDAWSTDVTVDNVLAFANDSAGFNWEISDRLKVSRLYSVYNQIGWLSLDGSRVTLENSVIASNRLLQVLTENTERRYDSEVWTVSGTTIAAGAGNQSLLWDTFPHLGGFRVGSNNTMDTFAATFTATNNTYFHPLFAAAFRKGDGSPLSLSQWQAYTGQEIGSLWNEANVALTMNNLKLEIQNQWGISAPSLLGYHLRPQLPW